MSFASSAQHKQYEWEKRISVLRDQGIDSFILYSPCESSLLPPLLDTCRISNKKYFIWTNGKKTFVQKFSDCFNEEASAYTELASVIVTLDSSAAFNYFLTNLDAIISDEILPSILRDTVNGKVQFIPIKAFDYCYIGIDIFLKTSQFPKGFSDDRLFDGKIHNEDGSIRAFRENINYDHNKSSPIYQLSLLLDNFITALEKQNSFKF